MAEAPSRSKNSRTGAVPLAVWPVAQVSAQYQRAGRYHPDSSAHPGKMLPALARRIVEEYSEPGALVVDPMAGIGTTLVEAAALGRRAVGVGGGWRSPARTSTARYLRSSDGWLRSGEETPAAFRR